VSEWHEFQVLVQMGYGIQNSISMMMARDIHFQNWVDLFRVLSHILSFHLVHSACKTWWLTEVTALTAPFAREAHVVYVLHSYSLANVGLTKRTLDSVNIHGWLLILILEGLYCACVLLVCLVLIFHWWNW
jgi:hypothetical protein